MAVPGRQPGDFEQVHNRALWLRPV
eukprot:COSAG04_NODE_14962_length_548_cov_1.318486_1_plen_24_part_01